MSRLRQAAVMGVVAGLLGPAAVAGAPSATVVGPGPVRTVVHRGDAVLRLRITPNAAKGPDVVTLAVRRGGAPLRHARVAVRFAMPAMSMGAPRFRLRERAPGSYRYTGPALSMRGLWVLTFSVRSAHGRRLGLTVRDHVGR